MLNNVNIIEASDWSKIENLKYSQDIFCYKNANEVDTKNLGIYMDENKRYRSSGYVGVCILKDKYNNDYIGPDFKRIILVVKPRFSITPWEMLAEVMKDEEYDCYMANTDKKIYEIMEDEKPLKMGIDCLGGGVLLAITYIRSCYKICCGILNRKMDYICENLNGKIKGRIDIGNHIRKNVARGREDKIYCKYPTFSVDTIENRIMKKALLECERLLIVNHCLEVDGLSKVRSMLKYCKNSLKKVLTVTIKKSNFSMAKTKGFNSMYDPIIKLSEMVLSHSSMNVNVGGEKTGYVLPHAINMESIFEFYIRTKIKQYLAENKNIRLDSYRDISQCRDLLKTSNNSNVYLMKNYIPDIALQVFDTDKAEWKYAAVMDVKYQRSTSNINSGKRRHNTHQLMFYTLLLNVKKCGFIFPLEKESKHKSEEADITLQNGDAEGTARVYKEFHIGDSEIGQANVIDNIINYVLGEEIMKNEVMGGV